MALGARSQPNKLARTAMLVLTRSRCSQSAGKVPTCEAACQRRWPVQAAAICFATSDQDPTDDPTDDRMACAHGDARPLYGVRHCAKESSVDEQVHI